MSGLDLLLAPFYGGHRTGARWRRDTLALVGTDHPRRLSNLAHCEAFIEYLEKGEDGQALQRFKTKPGLQRGAGAPYPKSGR